MHLAYDATALLGPRTGIGIMATRLLEGLADERDLHVTAFACTWRGRHRLRRAVPLRVRVAARPIPARPAHFVWRHIDLPPVEWITGRVDVVHGPNFLAPPTKRAARVITVHDLTAVHHPELCTDHTRRYPHLIGRAIEQGAWVHTVSDFVRAEVIDHFGADPERVVTVPNGVDPIPDAAPADGHRLAGGDEYLLAIGTVEPRKDYPALVAAFDTLAARHPHLRLVIAGPDGWGMESFTSAVEGARHRDRVVRLGYVDETARAALLHGARALVYPSVYEGFGLPPLEAMGAGTPVVATDAGAVREVCADAAELVSLADPDALTAGIERVLTDDTRRAELVRRGRERAATFSWAKHVSGILALYGRATPES